MLMVVALCTREEASRAAVAFASLNLSDPVRLRHLRLEVLHGAVLENDLVATVLEELEDHCRDRVSGTKADQAERDAHELELVEREETLAREQDEHDKNRETIEAREEAAMARECATEQREHAIALREEAVALREKYAAPASKVDKATALKAKLARVEKKPKTPKAPRP
jgi:hypothetical protein